MIAISLSLSFAPWWLALALVAAGALAYWSYHRTTPSLPTGRRLLLGGLRFGALAIVIALLFEPVLRRTVSEERPPAVAVLADNSQSLGPRGTTATDTTTAAVRRSIRALSENSDAWRPFLFGGSAQAVDPAASFADSLAFSAPRTNVARALSRARQELEQDNLRGVVLVSDGQYNAGRNPLYLADRYPVPIYTMVAGDTTRLRDLLVRRVSTNEVVYKGTEVPVQVRLQTKGFTGQRVTVGLYDGSERLDAQSVTLPDEERGEVPVELSFTPREAGLQQYEVRVTRLEGEATHRNNRKPFTVRVLESRKNVVLLGAAPGPDVAATRQILERLQSVALDAYVQRGAGSYYGGPLPDDLSEAADVLVLAGWPGSAAQATTVERVRTAIEDGTPVLFLLTRQTDLSALGESLADVLPAAPDNARSAFTEAMLRVTAAGRGHPVFEVPNVPLSVYGELPPLRYNQSRWQAAPDASVLATPQVKGVSLDGPMIAVQRRAGRRAAAVLAAGTWRWTNLPGDLERADPLWPGVLSNLVQWVTTPDARRQVRVEPVRQTFAGDEPVELTGQVYDESFDPIDNASVEVTVTAPGGKKYPYTMNATGSGQYELSVGSLPAGTYQYRARATRDGQALGSDQGSFAVGALTLEFQETRADAGLMRQVARRSGGAAFSVGEEQALFERIREAGLLKSSVRTSTRETALWHVYWMLAAVVALLAAEWFFRKRSGLV